MDNNKKFNRFIILVIVIFSILALLTLLGNYLFKSGKLLNGKWICNNNIILIMNKNKTFEMYDSKDKNYLNVKGKYTIEKEQNENNILKYTINMKTTNRIISNQKMTDEYTTQYEIDINTNNQNELSMTNSLSYSIYNCKKEK